MTPARRPRLTLESLETREQPASAAPTLAHLPLSFESNVGQVDSSIDYISRGLGYSLALARGQATLGLSKADGSSLSLSMSVAGGNPVIAKGLDPLPGKVNYLAGGDPASWKTDIGTVGRVEYPGVYSGIDLIYYGSQQSLEFDFNVAPGADPTQIALSFRGAESKSLDDAGNLVLHTGTGDVIEQAPVLYQDVNGWRRPVPGKFVVNADDTVGFQVGNYDHSRALVIDPVLSYLSYFGGNNNDEVKAVGFDAQGNIYLAGRISDDTFPAGVQAVPSPFSQGYVARLNPAGTQLLSTTFLDFDREGVTGMAVDAAGSAYVVGSASLSNLATSGAAQTTNAGQGDVYVAKLNPAGNGIVYATYLGGTGMDEGHAIAVDSAGNAFVTGSTSSSNFPHVNAVQPTFHTNSGGDAFVTKINPAGTQFLFSTFLGGNTTLPDNAGASFSEANGIALDKSGNVYVTGRTEAADFASVNPFQATLKDGIDAFVTEFKADGSQILYSSFVGGSVEDIGYGVAVDHAGNILVTGSTTSGDLPVKNAFQVKVSNGGNPGNRDAFVTKLNPALTGSSQLVYSTFDGGSANEDAYAITVDRAGNAYVVGNEVSELNFKTVNPFRGHPRSGGLFLKLSPAGRALINSPVGGGGDTVEAVAVSAFGDVAFGGVTGSTFLPTTSDAFQKDFPGLTSVGFVAKINGAVKFLTFIDTDDDRYTVKLSGPGSLNVVQDVVLTDPDGTPKGPISGIYFENTTPRSRITVSVRRVGDGEVDIGEVKGGGLGGLSATHSNLVGAGVVLAGGLGSMRLADILGGADILASNSGTQATSVTAHQIKDGTTINVGGAIKLLKAASVGNATVQATNLTTLSVVGDKKAAIAGDFAGSVDLSGSGVVLNSATFAGSVRGASFTLASGELKSFRAANYTGSNILADKVDRVLLSSITTVAGGTNFGIHATSAIGPVRVTSPTFTYNSTGPATQSLDNFVVTLG